MHTRHPVPRQHRIPTVLQSVTNATSVATSRVYHVWCLVFGIVLQGINYATRALLHTLSRAESLISPGQMQRLCACVRVCMQANMVHKYVSVSICLACHAAHREDI